MIRYRISLTSTAQMMLRDIPDKRIQQKIADVINKLETDPDKQGKPLVGPLQGCRSIRAAGQRYRIIYKIQANEVLVIILGVGIRKDGHRSDIYARIQKLVRLKLIE